MSKATQAAELGKAKYLPEFTWRQLWVAEVTPAAQLRLQAMTLPANKALDLAHWILDTFGEPEVKP